MLEDMLDEIQAFLPDLLVGSFNKDNLLEKLKNGMLQDVSSFEKGPTKRMDVVLYPPGTGIHLFFDGFGVTGSIVSCTFFNELDINRRIIHDNFYDPGYNKIFLDLMRKYHNDNHYAFQNEKGEMIEIQIS
jgi:hypothetical protein